MSSNTNLKNDGLVTFRISVDGMNIPYENNISSILVSKAINNIATAKIALLDGDASTGDFTVSSSNTFVPGKKITIEAGYDTKNKLIFKGIITGQSLQINESKGSMVEVECRDEAVKMIVGRKSATYHKMKDSDIISSILNRYQGLSSNVTATTTTWPEQVQNEATDWDFILSRAEVNGLIVTTLDNQVSVVKPDADTTSVLTIEYGYNLIELNTNLNSINQLDTVKGNAWDYKSQQIITGSAENSIPGPGNLSSKELSKVIGLQEYELQTSGTLQQPELNTWSQARIMKSEYSKILGEVKFQGTSVVNPSKYITLQGVGDRFNGDYLISRVVHELADGDWRTTASLGLPMHWATEQKDVMPPPASGLLPGVRGLMNGTVKKIYEDPENQYRILVDIPLFDNKGEGIWARLSNFYASNGAGSFFLPEVGDEVVVGFMNEDPRYPVILGSLYSRSAHTPYIGLEPNEHNSKKAIVSKSGIFIAFDDENKEFTISTPGNNTITVSDKDKSITIKDINENKIEMSSNGIAIKSPKNIEILAGQKLTFKGEQGIDIEASTTDVNVRGLNINQRADNGFVASGGASASIEAGAELKISGAMVMIN